jgi:hypothetical protein
MRLGRADGPDCDEEGHEFDVLESRPGPNGWGGGLRAIWHRDDAINRRVIAV